MSDEQRERMLIAEQIERATAEAGPSGSSESPPPEEGLKRDEESEKVVISFGTKPIPVPDGPNGQPSSSAAATPTPDPIGLKMNPLKPASNPLKPKVNPLKASNPLKRANPLKASAPSSSHGEETKKRSAPMTAVEQLILEDQQRKRRKMDQESLA